MLQLREIPGDAEGILQDLANFLYRASFDRFEICNDNLLGFKCHSLSEPIGIPWGKVSQYTIIFKSIRACLTGPQEGGCNSPQRQNPEAT